MRTPRLQVATLLILAAWPAVRLAAAEPTVIDLWPEGVPGLRADVPPEKTEDRRTYHVSHPTLTEFRPAAGKAVPTAIILCPGGGYTRLAIDIEGSEIANFLTARGIAAFVLKYRLADYGHPAPLRDVLRAVRLVRSRAAEFGVEPDRIGVLGGSAGGHLAACAGTLYDSPEGRTGAPLDAVSGRPDFLILLYPVITMVDPYVHAGSRRSLLGANPSMQLEESLSPQLHVTPATPPAFIVHSEEDKSVPIENSILFYRALRDAGVPVEMHLYEHGPHGFGMAAGYGTTAGWPERCAEWMGAHGWLAAAAPAARQVTYGR